MSVLRSKCSVLQIEHIPSSNKQSAMAPCALGNKQSSITIRLTIYTTQYILEQGPLYYNDNCSRVFPPHGLNGGLGIWASSVFTPHSTGWSISFSFPLQKLVGHYAQRTSTMYIHTYGLMGKDFSNLHFINFFQRLYIFRLFHLFDKAFKKGLENVNLKSPCPSNHMYVHSRRSLSIMAHQFLQGGREGKRPTSGMWSED